MTNLGRALGFLVVVVGPASTVPWVVAGPVPTSGASTSGEVRVNGQTLSLAHAYLFHAPDQWKETETNAIAVLTPKPLDEAALKKCTTLAEALKLAPERAMVEVKADGKNASLQLCHPGLEGSCYSTTVGSEEWTPATATKGHVAGHVRMFGGEATVFQKYKLFYEFTFDAAPVQDFAKRR